MSTVLETKLNEILNEKTQKIIPDNIKSGVTIFGVNGEYKGLDTSDATAKAQEIFKGKTAYVNGEKITGTYEETSSGGSSEYNTLIEPSVNKTFKVYNCLTEIDSLDMTGVTSMEYAFQSCTALRKINDITNTSEVTSLYEAFRATDLIEIPSFSIPKVTTIRGIFNNCANLETVPEFECSSVNNIYQAFKDCNNLKNFGGFKNIGKAFDKLSANATNHKFDLSNSPKLTHESLMNIINGLYDLNLTYNVAGGGTLYTQSLVLGNTNLAKLTAEEIAIATAKRLVC